MTLTRPAGSSRIILWLMVTISILSCTREKPPQKLVVLTFDDAVRSHLEYVAPLLKEKGFGATFFVCDLWMRDSVNFLQWDEVGKLHQMGFEIANHTWTHAPLLKEADFAGMKENLGKVDSALLAHGVPRPLTFGYPGNLYAPGAVEKIRELGYTYARRGMQPEIPYGKIAHGPLYDPSRNHPLLIPTTADAYPEWTLDYFKSVVDRATPGKAVILQFHGVPDVAHPWVHTDPLLFAQFMDYLEESGVKVIAMKDLEKYLDVQEVNDPALKYAAGAPGLFNPCPEEGDVWILAGQSNMQGAGRTPDTLTHPHIWMMNLDDRWSMAGSPLHRIFESRAPAYALSFHELNGQGKALESTLELFRKNAAISRNSPLGGTGPGLYFARHIQETIGLPVGLIPCALGGSTIDQWDPRHSRSGDSCLYGAMLNRARTAGIEQIRGLIWYQGESEAMLGESASYKNKLLRFIDAVRKDLDQSDLPIIIVQIGRLNSRNPEMEKHWEVVRETQRKISDLRSNVYLTTGIDLKLDDVAHLSTNSNRRLGSRIGELALHHVYGIQTGADQPTLFSMEMDKDPASGSHFLRLHYKGINGSLQSDGRPWGFELRFENETRIPYVISRTELDPDEPAALRLYLSAVPQEAGQLYYGPGINPYLNITDSMDMPLLAFGPIPIDFEKLKTQIIYVSKEPHENY